MWDAVFADDDRHEHHLRLKEFTGESLAAIMPNPVLRGASVLGWPEHVAEELAATVPTWLTPPDDPTLETTPEWRYVPPLADGMTGHLEILYPAAEGAESTSAASIWIDESVAFIEKPVGVTELTIRYTRELTDDVRLTSLELGALGTTDSYLEWFVATGTNTGTGRGDAQLSGHGRAKQAVIRMGEGTGRIVARVVNVLVRASTRDRHDPWQGRRQRALENARPELAAAIPQLTDDYAILDVPIPPKDPPRPIELVVLVHGTVSSSMRMAASLFGARAELRKGASVVRYEHDTWISVSENADHLADLLRKVYRSRRHLEDRIVGEVERLLLIGHSRGGLVCVEAAKRLTSPHEHHLAIGSTQIQVLTYGAPHAGTPLVDQAAAATSIVRAFGAVASKMAFAHFGVDALSWGFGFALKLARLPSGIQVMSPSNDWIRNRQLDPFTFEVHAWGARMTPVADGFFPALKGGYLIEAMGGMESDGVVPTSSAIAGRLTGSSVLSKDTDHSGYFDDPTTAAELRQRIERRRPLGGYALSGL